MNISDNIGNSSFGLERSVTMELCQKIDSPRSLMLWLILQHHEYEQLIELDFNSLHYIDTSQFRDDYLVSSLLKKSPNIPVKVDRRQNAIDAFWASEQKCKETNASFNSAEPILNLHKVKSVVQKILGELDSKALNRVEANLRFGPGASAFTRAQGAVLSDKYDREIYLTESLYPFYKSLLGESWWDTAKRPVIVGGNEFTTVPKTSKVDRGICKEPSLNSFLQLGIGRVIREKLRRTGIDLTSQDKNQFFAKHAFNCGYATIDLSMASDTLAYSVVRELLDRRWFHLLTSARSATTTIKESDSTTVTVLEKFSSMGNGYTFELESLIFYAICRSCVPKGEHHLICTYGDDLIVPIEYAKDVVDTLNAFGFKVNTEKSYLAGNFFESCGRDFFRGQPVRPFYLRGGRKDNLIPYEVQIANSIRHYSRHICHDLGCDIRFRDTWLRLFKAAPRQWRLCLVDPAFGDSGFVVSFIEAERTLKEPKHGHEGWMVRHIQLKPKRVRKQTLGRYFLALSQAGLSEIASLGFEPRRGLFGSPVTKSTLVNEWTPGYSWIESS